MPCEVSDHSEASLLESRCLPFSLHSCKTAAKAHTDEQTYPESSGPAHLPTEYHQVTSTDTL